MSAPTSSSINLASRQLTIYFGIPVLITGLIGGLFNIIVFLSLKTFRESSCAFYLTIMSIVNIGHLLTGLLTRIMITGFHIDLTELSLFYCKFRPYCLQTCVLISFTCMCLATIDQYLATCSKVSWQQWSNIKTAHRLTLFFIVFWLLHDIPCLIYFNITESTINDENICGITNENFHIYYIGVQAIGFDGIIPVLLNSLFALLAYKNVQTLSYRTIPLVRRELDKQLTTIVLIQAVYNIISTIPYLIINIFTLNAIIMKDSNTMTKLEFVITLTLCVFYLNFSMPFYMYMCASGRFRHQFMYVFCKIHFNRCRQRIVIVNQVMPQS